MDNLGGGGGGYIKALFGCPKNNPLPQQGGATVLRRRLHTISLPKPPNSPACNPKDPIFPSTHKPKHTKQTKTT